MPLPDTLAMMRQLVGIPSVSSVSPDIDMGNLKVVELLAEWLQELNFTVEIISPEKSSREGEPCCYIGARAGRPGACWTHRHRAL